MRKIIISVVALAVLAVPTVASAAVSYDATNDGVITGYVGKGDVQPVLGWNEAKVQSTPVQFSTTFTTFTDTSWRCTNDGETRHNVKSLTFKQGLTSAVVLKSNGKIDGWNLTGLGSLEFVKQTITGPAKYDCTGAGWMDYMSLGLEQSHALGDDLFVNGVLLPETPVAVPVA